jgi:hypothetical protein
MFNLAIDSKLRGCDVVALKTVKPAWLASSNVQGGGKRRLGMA